MSDNEIIDFESKFKNKINNEITFFVDDKEYTKGILKEVELNFCIITFKLEGKQVQIFYPFLYSQSGNTHTLSYKLKDLMVTTKGKELVLVLIDDTAEDNQSFLFNRILKIQC